MLTTIKFIRRTLIHSLGVFFALSLVILGVPVAHAESGIQTTDGAQILQSFNKQHRDAEHAKSITTKEKQQIMFLMGVFLFLLVLITGGLGIAMGIYGKDVFVAHMLFAGLSISMAIAHAIVGLVWFYPF